MNNNGSKPINFNELIYLGKNISGSRYRALDSLEELQDDSFLINCFLEMVDGRIITGTAIGDPKQNALSLQVMHTFGGVVYRFTNSPELSPKRVLTEYNVPRHLFNYDGKEDALGLTNYDIQVPNLTTMDEMMAYMLGREYDLRISFLLSSKLPGGKQSVIPIVTPANMKGILSEYIVMPVLIELKFNVKTIGYCYYHNMLQVSPFVNLLGTTESVDLSGKEIYQIQSIRQLRFSFDENNVQRLSLGDEIYLVDNLESYAVDRLLAVRNGQK